MEHTFSLADFKKAHEEMIAKPDASWSSRYMGEGVVRSKEYTIEEVDKIINSSSLAEQQKLSRNYFYRDGFYKRIILYYGTLLTYTGLLIPNPAIGKQLSTPHIAKRYYSALEYVDKMNLAEVMTRMSIRVLIDGVYYGIIQTQTKDKFVMFDLPTAYCRGAYAPRLAVIDIIQSHTPAGFCSENEVRDGEFRLTFRVIPAHRRPTAVGNNQHRRLRYPVARRTDAVILRRFDRPFG